MKNTKKIVSLILAICMIASLAISASAANTVDASGGTGTSSVTLSSTADGSIGGDPAATKMSVTVPTVERGFLEVVFWSMEMAGDRPSM